MLGFLEFEDPCRGRNCMMEMFSRTQLMEKMHYGTIQRTHLVEERSMTAVSSTGLYSSTSRIIQKNCVKFIFFFNLMKGIYIKYFFPLNSWKNKLLFFTLKKMIRIIFVLFFQHEWSLLWIYVIVDEWDFRWIEF